MSCINKNCGHNHCGACCGGSCQSREILLTPNELELLWELSVFAFLPFAAKSAGGVPIYHSSTDDAKYYETEILSLQQKGLISADYDMPLSGCIYELYSDYPIHGSMALTLYGQAALDALDYQPDVLSSWRISLSHLTTEHDGKMFQEIFEQCYRERTT